jgi:hypothetical protein
MPNSSVSLVQPEALKKNKLSVHGYLGQSYTQAKKQLEERTAVFKPELETFDQAVGSCADRMLLRVNNFLKDFTQMEEDFLAELHTNKVNVIPIEHAIASGKMEENY